MTADTAPQFSAATVSAVLAEANALHLKGATAITVALRNQLTLMKSSGAVPDNRTVTYWAGIDHPDVSPGWEEFEGLAAVAGALWAFCEQELDQKRVRVELARKEIAEIPLVSGGVAGTLYLRNTPPV